MLSSCFFSSSFLFFLSGLLRALVFIMLDMEFWDFVLSFFGTFIFGAFLCPGVPCWRAVLGQSRINIPSLVTNPTDHVAGTQ